MPAMPQDSGDRLEEGPGEDGEQVKEVVWRVVALFVSMPLCCQLWQGASKHRRPINPGHSTRSQHHTRMPVKPDISAKHWLSRRRVWWGLTLSYVPTPRARAYKMASRPPREVPPRSNRERRRVAKLMGKQRAQVNIVLGVAHLTVARCRCAECQRVGTPSVSGSTHPRVGSRRNGAAVACARAVSPKPQRSTGKRSGKSRDPALETWRNQGELLMAQQEGAPEPLYHHGDPVDRTVSPEFTPADPWGEVTSFKRALELREASCWGDPSEPTILSEEIQQRILHMQTCYYERVGHRIDQPARVTPVMIELAEGAPNEFVARHPFRGPRERTAIDHACQEMHDLGILEQCDSPHCHPFVLVPKKNGEIRATLDLRKLNAHIKGVTAELGAIDQVLWEIGASPYVSCLDVSKAFWQVPLDPESRNLLAMAWPGKGIWRPTRLMFGLKSATALFVNRLQEVLAGLEGVVVFCDDIIVFAQMPEQLVCRLQALFERLADRRIVLNLTKCKHGLKKLLILGMDVTPGRGYMPSEESVAKLRGLRKPRTLKQLQALVGTCNWVLARMLPRYADHMVPIQDLLSEAGARAALEIRKEMAKSQYESMSRAEKDKVRAKLRKKTAKSPVDWTPAAEEAMERVRQLLTEGRVGLALPAFNHAGCEVQLAVSTDASNYGTGGALWQRVVPLAPETTEDSAGSPKEDLPHSAAPPPIADKVWKLLAVDSHRFDPRERNWSTSEKEAAAMWRALRKWRSILLYVVFDVFTDHRNLLWMENSENRKVRAWYADISDLSFVIYHVEGVHNRLPDLLSRCSLPSYEELPPETLPDEYRHLTLREAEAQGLISPAERRRQKCPATAAERKEMDERLGPKGHAADHFLAHSADAPTPRTSAGDLHHATAVVAVVTRAQAKGPVRGRDQRRQKSAKSATSRNPRSGQAKPDHGTPPVRAPQPKPMPMQAKAQGNEDADLPMRARGARKRRPGIERRDLPLLTREYDARERAQARRDLGVKQASHSKSGSMGDRVRRFRHRITNEEDPNAGVDLTPAFLRDAQRSDEGETVERGMDRPFDFPTHSAVRPAEQWRHDYAEWEMMLALNPTEVRALTHVHGLKAFPYKSRGVDRVSLTKVRRVHPNRRRRGAVSLVVQQPEQAEVPKPGQDRRWQATNLSIPCRKGQGQEGTLPEGTMVQL